MKIRDQFFEIAMEGSTSKIENELNSINESSETKKKEIRRRWIWELIQNASDCTPKDSKIDIILNITKDSVEFSHNGKPFTYNDLLSLITQFSLKQKSKDKLTGKFGTGFMSTLLLSKIVNIEGTLIRQDGAYTNMNFIIDRSKSDHLGIQEQTEAMIDKLDELDLSTEISHRISTTKFIYNVSSSEDSREAVVLGVKDLLSTVSYLIAFNQNINTISINGKVYSKEQDYFINNGQINVFSVKEEYQDNIKYFHLWKLERNNVTIACPVDYNHETSIFNFLPIDESTPKLFCNFPLIGTESFSFPIILNSDLFQVHIDRNAIRDTNPKNKELIQEAISLYKLLIEFCSSTITKDEFNICIIEENNHDELPMICYSEIMSYIKKIDLIPIIDNEDNIPRRYAFNYGPKKKVVLPKTDKEENEIPLWELIFEAGGKIPTKETFFGWRKVFDSNFNFTNVNLRFKDKEIETFSSKLKNERKALEWLERFYSYWIKDIGIEKVIKLAIVPAQDRKFHDFNNVLFDSGIDPDLKDILFELEPSKKSKLLSSEIKSFDSYYDSHKDEQEDNVSIANLIEKRVNQILANEHLGDSERKAEVQATFTKLNYFILKEQELSEEIFPKIMNKRFRLTSNEESLEMLEVANKVKQHNLNLDEIITNQTKIDYLLDNLDNPSFSKEEILDLLRHKVKSTKENFEYLINRSIDNVYEHLNSNPLYDLPDTVDEWKESSHSSTVFEVLKESEVVFIVIRPSDENQIFFYYEEELEALDSNNYELWTDNGNECNELTLGELLKTTGITRIPLKNLF
ncbi:ATP-binding protein [Shouchella miscanthi]|uniref:ATP-binding protein n=1 Tax=Shouchella miscanthi TaxID=2598861 RepID=UPI00119DD177|nr:ATP-binding protein [Shouchella miscanthi]